jgi:dihydrofolate synthase/folylpolyglutamate synthase
MTADFSRAGVATAPDDAYYAALDALVRPRAAATLPESLEPMRALLAALGIEPPFPLVVVAGSTGKGTTALRLAAGLASGGLRVGLYTSPHLHSFRERFAVLNLTPHSPLALNLTSQPPLQPGEGEKSAALTPRPPLPQVEGEQNTPRASHPSPEWRGAGGEVSVGEAGGEVSVGEGEVSIAQHSALSTQHFFSTASLISPAAFTLHARAVLNAASALDFAPSTFESATALALHWFAAQAVDVAVCEIGLGGRFDAVNAAAHPLALIGPIELEHAAMLGGTLERIAWHKAGVIPAGGAAFALRPHSDMVRAVFAREAQQKGAALAFTDDTAQAGLDWFRARGLVPPDAAIPPDSALPGRLERVQIGARQIIIDGGHTPLAARRLAAALHPALAEGARVIVGMLADKDAVAYLRELDQPGVALVLTTAPAERARPAAELAAVFAPEHALVEVQPSFDAALSEALNGPQPTIAVAGSLRMAAAAREALGLLDAAALEEARRTRGLFEGPVYRARWGG